MKVELFANTNGKGYWSDKKKEVLITSIKIGQSFTYGESFDAPDDLTLYIEARFDAKTWNIYLDGLIYTDEKFITDFRKGLVEMGLPSKLAKMVDYTEHGMQGRLHVGLVFHGDKKDMPAWEEFMGHKIKTEEC